MLRAFACPLPGHGYLLTYPLPRLYSTGVYSPFTFFAIPLPGLGKPLTGPLFSVALLFLCFVFTFLSPLSWARSFTRPLLFNDQAFTFAIQGRSLYLGFTFVGRAYLCTGVHTDTPTDPEPHDGACP